MKFLWAARDQPWRRATKDEDTPKPSAIGLAGVSRLGEQNPSLRRDRALGSFSFALHVFEPESAMNWVREIWDPATREAAIQEQFSLWEARDPEAARSWKEKQE